MKTTILRPITASLLAGILSLAPGAPAFGQEQSQTKPDAPAPQQPATPNQASLQLSKHNFSRAPSAFPILINPYRPIKIERPELTNSPRIAQMIRDGKLELSLQDAIALALENNLDLIVQRYNPWIADTDILRTKAGGVGRGLAGTGTASALGAIPSENFDPTLTSSILFDDRSIPVNNPFLSGTGTAQLTSLVTHTAQYNLQYAQGFHTGTGFAVAFNNTRSSTSSPAALFNPSVQSSLFVSFSQQLLNGFGLLPNTRFIRLAKNNKKIADLAFTQQVITTITTVENLYWELVFARENVHVAERAVAVAEKLYNDNKRQVEIGTMAPIDVVRAEAEVARNRQDLIVARTAQLQQEQLLKNAITRNPLDPTLLNVEIVPTELPPSAQQVAVEALALPDAVKEALAKRPDVLEQEYDLKNRDINVRATRNALLPVLTLFGQYGSVGLGGNSRAQLAALSNPFIDANGNPVTVTGLDQNGVTVPAFIPTTVTSSSVTPGGLSDALSSVFNNRFPDYSLQLNLSIPIRNRSAQADSQRALLEQRQAVARMQQLQNNVVIDVRNTQIALEQNRARVEAAVKARILQEQTLDAEQKKYQLGASTVFLVIQAQRDLTSAQSVELRALVDLVKARVDYERALGRTLEVNRVTIAEAKSGQPVRQTLIPGTVRGQIVGTGPGTAF
jgi:outer membrane protein TolC